MVAINFEATGVSGPLTFDTFGCRVFKLDGITDTPDRIAPTQSFNRKVHFDATRTMWDGQVVPFWSFEDPIRGPRGTFPAPTLRMRQGELVHTTLETRSGTHTIHHHGIEPTTVNDGAGHVSFEVNGTYTYQMQPTVSGTFLYHCHKNTVLHFEMGMYGFLIVDPPAVTPPANVPFGSKQCFAGGPWYQAEAPWVFDDVDPRWHQMHFSAGLCGEDVGLNRFEPKYFLVNGAPYNTRRREGAQRVQVRRGETLLMRLLNAAYGPLAITMPDRLGGQVVSIDGRPLGGASGAPWSRPFALQPRQRFVLSTAGRYDVLVTIPATERVGSLHQLLAEFLHFTTMETRNRSTDYQGRVHTEIEVI
jgi:FtsP/CotA-like multicopper oxidase with cupredoxin domain